MRQVFLDAYKHGITRFMTGMAVGFDMLAAEVVLSVKGICSSITLMAVIPYSGQAERFSDYNRRRYDALRAQADETVVLSDQYYTRYFWSVTALWLSIPRCSLPAMMVGRRVVRSGQSDWLRLARRVVNVY